MSTQMKRTHSYSATNVDSLDLMITNALKTFSYMKDSYPGSFAVTSSDNVCTYIQPVQFCTLLSLKRASVVNNKCDKITISLNNQQNTLSETLSTTYLSNCREFQEEKLLGLLLVVGGVLIAILIGSLLIGKEEKFLKK